MSPKLVDREERKTQLLTAAISVFGDKGYHGATMQDVADVAGVSKGGLYDYFASKEELLLCTAEWLLQNTLHAILPLLERPGTPLGTRVAAAMDVLMSQAEDIRPVVLTIFQVWAEIGPGEHSPLHALSTHMYKDFADKLQAIFETAIAAGDVRPFPTRPVALSIMAVIDGMLLQLMIAPDEFAINRKSRFVPQWCASAVGTLTGAPS